jgi:hypothetical protein
MIVLFHERSLDTHTMQRNGQERSWEARAWYTEVAATPTRWWVTIDEENETIKHFVDVAFGESAIHPLWYKCDTLRNDSRRNGIRLLRQGRQKLGARMARHQDMLTLLVNNYNEMSTEMVILTHYVTTPEGMASGCFVKDGKNSVLEWLDIKTCWPFVLIITMRCQRRW